jgi:formylglycine-generating enzyme
MARMERQGSSVVIGLMALLTLVMAMLLPVLGREFSSGSPDVAQSSSSPSMIALDHQRSPLVRVSGGAYFRGTTPDEAESALTRCREDGGCDSAVMEDSFPPHQVSVSTFWMDKTEVTYQQYVTFLNTLSPGGHAYGCLGQLCALIQAEASTSSIVLENGTYRLTNPALGDYPVTNVTWYGAQAYCEALGRRLPTEAEWEYTARGAAGSLYPWGNEWNSEAANALGSVRNQDGVIIARPQPVGGRPAGASRDGVRDLAGNVAEWVADWYAPDHYLTSAATRDNDPGPASGTERVIRGGSWNDLPFFARAVQRGKMPPQETSDSVGFRCAQDG